MENKETSIQWLMSQAVNWARNTNSGNDIVEFPKGAINQAKEMEKEQHANTWDDNRVEDKGDNYIGKQKSFNDYYEQKYGGNK